MEAATTSAPLDLLRQMKYEYCCRKYPNIPEGEQRSIHLGPKAPRYKDDTANGLTACITDFMKFSGGYAVRINTQGQWDASTGKYRKGATEKGTSDIHACYKGRFMSIEVKAGRDKQSEDQQKVEAKVIAAGGYYYVARSFAGFYEWFTSKQKRG